MIQTLKDFLKFAYLGRLGPSFQIRRTTVEPPTPQQQTPGAHSERARVRIVQIFSWAMTLVLLVWLLVEVVFPLIGKNPPERLSSLGLISLGYMVGIVNSFFGLKPTKRPTAS